MEPLGRVPLEIRANEQEEIRKGRTLHYQSPNPEMVVEAKRMRRGMRERMRQMLRVRRRFDDMRKMQVARQERLQQRGKALNVARRFMDYAVTLAPSGSRKEKQREKVRDGIDRLAD